MTRPGELKIVLALGAGGVRGLAHIGVLQVFREEGIPIHAIAGTSMGAMVGVAFGAGSDLYYLEKLVEFLPWQDFIDIGIHRMGLVEGDRVLELIRILTKGKRLEELTPPVWVVATNLQTGQEVVFTEGRIDLAVRASISIPGFFAPVIYENRILVDGGVVAGVPVTVARRMGPDFVIAVHVAHDFKRAQPKNMVDVLLQTVDIMGNRLDTDQIMQADLVITPDVGNVGTLELNRSKECIQKGRDAARKVLPAIHRLLNSWEQTGTE